MKGMLGTIILVAGLVTGAGTTHAATVVALGASNTYGKGVARNQAYPAQLEALLRARGLNVHVVNAGINGDTTGGMLARIDRVVSKGTSVVILQPGPAATTGASMPPTRHPRSRAGSLLWASR